MNPFLDLRGASGAVYRFRLVSDPGQLPAEGGNFAYAKQNGERTDVICYGAGESLHQARERWADAVKDEGAQAIYVRLNISRKQRLNEHEDLLAASEAEA